MDDLSASSGPRAWRRVGGRIMQRRAELTRLAAVACAVVAAGRRCAAGRRARGRSAASDRLCPRHRADLRRALLPVSRAGQAGGRAAAGPARRRAGRRRLGHAVRGRQERRQRADAPRLGRRRRADAAAGRQQQAAVGRGQIARLTAWIDAGAEWPEGSAAGAAIGRSSRSCGREPPAVQARAAGLRTPIDRFVLARLEARGIAPSPEADRYTLIKRLYYDLLGCRRRWPKSTRSSTTRRRRLRAAGRPAARFAPLRRALGPALARHGPLCRLRRL